ncbi:MAG: DEAD/DEAH box helicase [Myxococcota bacterium]
MSEEIASFDSFSEEIRRGIEELGWKEPMPVQRRVIPVMRAGRDLIVQAVTGSGKTGGFGLPIVELIDPEQRHIQALILAPTRELAGQIDGELAVMGRHLGIRTIAIYGGTAYGPQLEAFERGVHIVTATPGRLLDHLKSRRMTLDHLQVLIFDEGDELLSLGFWPDMQEIQRFLPEGPLTGLFSATMPQRVVSLSRVFLVDPEFISFSEGGVRAPEEIEHWHYIVQASQKENELLRILRFEDPGSALIFCNTRDDTRFVSGFLQRHDLDADMIQGEMSQAAREAVMRRIKGGKLRILVATDVAARGIDISDLSHVISYSAPDQPEVYLHRTGRTGRAGKAGTAISLVSGLDIGNFRSLQKVNRMTIPERPLPSQSDVDERMAQRLQVEIEHDLRAFSERERKLREGEMLPIVERFAATDIGRRQLSAVLFSYLRDRHVSAPGTEIPSGAHTRDEAADESATREAEPARKRRRPRRRRHKDGE